MSLSHNKNEYVKPHNYDFPALQPQQAIAQLKKLRYKPGDTVHLRMIDPRRLSPEEERNSRRYAINAHLYIESESEDGNWNCLYTPIDKWVDTGEFKEDGTPKKKQVLNTNKTTANWVKAIEALNRTGYGIYFTVNKGGTKKADITSFTAAFFESDEGTHEQQWQAIAGFGIEPTFVVKTRKSLHTYFTLKSNDLTSEVWTNELQRPMIMAMNSDVAIQDPSRVMRLAGFNHAKWNEKTKEFDFVLCELYDLGHEKAPVYSVEQVKQAAHEFVGLYSEERFELWRRMQDVYVNKVAAVAAKAGFSYADARQQVRTMPAEDLELYARRYKRFHQLCLDVTKGTVVDPMSAWAEKEAKLPKADIKRTYKKSEIYSDVDEENSDIDTVQWARYMPFYNPNGRPGWITCQCPSVPAEDRHNHSVDSLHINKTTGAIKSQRGAENSWVYAEMKANYEAAIKEQQAIIDAQVDDQGKTAWQRLAGCDRQPDVILNQRYLAPIQMEKGVVYVLKSPKNTGKTFAAKEIVARYKNVLSVYSRIAQAEEQCPRLEIEFNNKPNKGKSSWKSPVKKNGCIANSVPHQQPDNLKDCGLLLMDEFNQIPDHILGNTCDKNRQTIYNLLQQAFSAALADGNVLLMSADIKNRDIELIEGLAAKSGAKVVYIENQFQIEKGVLNVVDCKDPFPVLQMALDKLKAREKVMLCFDTKSGAAGANAIAEYIRTELPETRVDIITGDNSATKEAKHYLKYVNETSLNTDCLIVSPAVTNGVSIENSHFNHVFGLYQGVITIDDVLQQLGRDRNCRSITLWAAQVGIGSSGYCMTPEDVEAAIAERVTEHTELMTEMMVEHRYTPMTHQMESVWFKHYCSAVAYRNQCMIKYRERILEQALLEGYSSISLVPVSDEQLKAAKELKKQLKTCSERLDVSEAHNVDKNGNNVSGAELEELLLLECKTDKQKADIAKTLLTKNYGEAIIKVAKYTTSDGEELTGYAAMYMMDKKDHCYRGWEMLRYLYLENGEELAFNKDLVLECYDFKQKDFTTDRSIHNLKHHLQKRRLLKELKVDEFLIPEKRFAGEDLYGLFKIAKKKEKKIQSYLNMKVGSYKHPNQFFKALMAKVGLEVKQDRSNKQRSMYITQESWDYFQMYLEYKASPEAAKATEVKPTQAVVEQVEEASKTCTQKAIKKHLLTKYIKKVRQENAALSESAIEALTARYSMILNVVVPMYAA